MYILIDQLDAVEDPRTGNAKRHKLGDILFIAIAAGVAGADTWYEIVEYAHTKCRIIVKNAIRKW